MTRPAATSEDVYHARLRAVIESLRYWMPSVADCARVEETEAAGYWKMGVTPRTQGACPFELIMRGDQRFDLMIGGETFEDLEIPFEDVMPLVDSISAGRVVQRRWISVATAALRDVETIVTFDNGRTWTGSRSAKPVPGHAHAQSCEKSDRVFLPYRR
jgi:hypothetical protein